MFFLFLVFFDNVFISWKSWVLTLGLLPRLFLRARALIDYHSNHRPRSIDRTRGCFDWLFFTGHGLGAVDACPFLWLCAFFCLPCCFLRFCQFIMFSGSLSSHSALVICQTLYAKSTTSAVCESGHSALGFYECHCSFSVPGLLCPVLSARR